MSTLEETALDFNRARTNLSKVIRRTPLQYNPGLSERYGCEVYLKREDLQIVRSYKLRGAYNMISSLPAEDLQRGVVCASAGNHAQGFAWSCNKLNVKGVVFMPEITPKQKVKQTQMFGKDTIQIILTGDTFDDCLREALKYAAEHGLTCIPPFDNHLVIEGQGTVGMEILEDLPDVDVAIVPVGGGGLASGLGSYLKSLKPGLQLIGVEPLGAPSMQRALDLGGPVQLESIDRFVDGAAVKRVGELTYSYCSRLLDQMLLVPEGKICTSILILYNEDAIVVEPAGALSVAALDLVQDQIKGKNVVCVVSGGNNDIERMQEIKEKSLLYEGLKHYFIIRFPQRPGALKLFVNKVLGPSDDITRFEFIKKTEREYGPALVGIELKESSDYDALLARIREYKFDVIELNQDQTLFEYLV